jgi:hypothetical protein
MAVDQTTGLTHFEAVAQLVWTALRTGTIPFASAAPAPLTAKQWIDLVMWVNKHIDGNRPSDSAPSTMTSSDGSSGDDQLPTFTALPDDIDALLSAPISAAAAADPTDPTDPTDALPELDAYLAQIAAAAAADVPIRPHINTPAPAQVGNPKLAYRLLMQARAERLARQGQGKSSSGLSR